MQPNVYIATEIHHHCLWLWYLCQGRPEHMYSMKEAHLSLTVFVSLARPADVMALFGSVDGISS